MLSDETAGDPLKKASLIRSIIESISIIPDSITRSVYTKECSVLLDVPEKALISELNKIRVKKHKDHARKEAVKNEAHFDEPPPEFFDPTFKKEKKVESTTFHQEKDIVRLMLNYGLLEIDVDSLDDEDNDITVKMKLADFVAEEIQEDDLNFEDETLQKIFDLYIEQIENTPQKDPIIYLTTLEDVKVRELVSDLVSEKYVLHKWQSQNIEVQTEEDKIFRAVRDALYAFKARKINVIIHQKRLELKDIQDKKGDILPILMELQNLDEIKRQLLSQQGITIF